LATVNFNNNVLFRTSGDRLVYGLSGWRVVGPEFTAQLYYGRTPHELRPVTNAPARFRPVPTSMPGTWSGGMRSLAGFNPGEMVWMQVRVWNATLFPAGYEAAVEAGVWHWASCPLTYTIPTLQTGLPSPDAFYMEGFRGNSCLDCCTPGWFNYWRTSNSLVLDWQSVRVTQKPDLAHPAWVAVTNQVFSLTSGPRFFKVEGNYLLLADP
jgi:hypothetical protein